ncbi:hypothetical protein F2Q70_00018709 [Brassica cretica]|uniref:Uncharacterized protein n=1 Tax=Brassica cretica TaxID=69181 RepID=A0A8S9HU76_BRACR|nr:hypothetical protein F2Q70_00018709 [Brassica cretica]
MMTLTSHGCHVVIHPAKLATLLEISSMVLLCSAMTISSWRSFPRVQPQERQQAKPCLSRTPPPPPPQAAAAPSPAKPAASRPRSPSRRNRAPSRRLLDSVSCKQLRSEP